MYTNEQKNIIMTKNPLKYQNYSPTWTKLFVAIGAKHVLGNNIPSTVFYGHNLYEKYQYNKEISKEVEVKLYDEAKARAVKIEPKYFDAQGLFYTTCLIANLCILGMQKILSQDSPHKETLETIKSCSNIANTVFFLSYFFNSNEKEFICTDIHTGEEIPYENMIRSDWFNDNAL